MITFTPIVRSISFPKNGNLRAFSLQLSRVAGTRLAGEAGRETGEASEQGLKNALIHVFFNKAFTYLT